MTTTALAVALTVSEMYATARGYLILARRHKAEMIGGPDWARQIPEDAYEACLRMARHYRWQAREERRRLAWEAAS